HYATRTSAGSNLFFPFPTVPPHRGFTVGYRIPPAQARALSQASLRLEEFRTSFFYIFPFIGTFQRLFIS
ncbi:MAG: hypothetical protein IJB33_04945, partial [Akkermansia sp.]|nr:hypothetical protein [Akkermansia sp.]